MYKKFLIFLLRNTLKRKYQSNNVSEAIKWTLENEKDMPFIIIVSKDKCKIK